MIHNNARLVEVLIYTPASSGMGHLVRMHRVAESLVRQGFKVACIFGLDWVPEEVNESRYQKYTLPRISWSRRGGFQNAELQPIYTTLIRQVILDLSPQYFLFSHPLGVVGELLPLFDEPDLWSRTKRILIWRDVVVSNLNESQLRNSLLAQRIRDSIDIVCICGQQELIDFRDYMPLSADLESKLRYVGYVAPELDDEPASIARKPKEMVISFGAGEHRRLLAERTLPNLLRAAELLGFRVTLYLGRSWSAEHVEGIRRTVESSLAIIKDYSRTKEYLRHVSQAAVLASAGGYNSVIEALKLQTPLLVLQGSGSASIAEVVARNRHFESLRLLTVFRDHQSVDEAVAAIRSVLKLDSSVAIRFDGTEKIGLLLRGLE